MQRLSIDKIRKWYHDRLGIDIPKTKLIEVSDRHVPAGLENLCLLVPPIRRWEDIDKNSFEASKQRALDLLYADLKFSELPRDRIGSVFEQLVLEEVENYNRKLISSHQLEEYIGLEGGERIYVFPLFQKLVAEISETKENVLIESLLAHEFFHQEQVRNGLEAKFPFSKEGPAWVLQFLYGADHMGFLDYSQEYERLAQKMNPTNTHSKQEREYIDTVVVGVNVVTKNLGIDFTGNSGVQLEKYRSIFEMPAYSYLESNIIYLYFKPKIQERLK